MGDGGTIVVVRRLLLVLALLAVPIATASALAVGGRDAERDSRSHHGRSREAAPPVARPAVPAVATPGRRPAAPTRQPSRAAGCAPGVRRVGTGAKAVALLAARPLTARSRPRSAAPAVATFPQHRDHGLRTVLLAVERIVGRDCRARWYRARLPQRPNGRTAWVRAADVVERAVATRVRVELSRRRLHVHVRGRRVLTVPVAIGAAPTPTPTGSYYIDRRFRLRDAGGPYGPAILAIAAYSEAPQGWARDNPIAIHGTNAPASVGRAASHGCLRVTNGVALRLLGLLPAGTPVDIAA